MNYKINLERSFFSEKPFVILKNNEFTVTLFKYESNIEGLEIKNSRGKAIVLPFMGQMIWDLEFDAVNLKMKNMFRQPKPVDCIVDTYGCFAFHSGLLANGCPSPEDTHPLHGEMPCETMDHAWLEIEDDAVVIGGDVEYAQGFGHHYLASPSVRLASKMANIQIGMKVKNLASVPMPLQYMCHMNYAYVADGIISSNLPDMAFKLRESIPAHVKPTKLWLEYNEEIKKMQREGKTLSKLDQPYMYDPEIVFMADKIEQYGDLAEFEIASPEGYTFFTKFSTQEFKYATRWILYNGDQQVAAFVLPGTCRPEGFTAAQKAKSLILLEPGEQRVFSVTTGKK